ncbi:MAG: sulfurtransferase-like selenium metabolism protein YedF [Desulfotignum sp.]|nr:sulfurtransferase-like selenium metabolism protein YedF [Desulfotignum sp.]MCF8087786.1 sulfurtransferase-like selenium metabolism protein YedF [Desulfotignum sp.]MCF8137014.1 sulfurtransferase-like selenium metabolism protein YedF [Desulfotignum sp.]
MTTDIDARGQACPQPVLMTKQVVDTERPSRLTVQVDNEAAVENVSRFLGTKGYEATTSAQGDVFTVSGVDMQKSGNRNDPPQIDSGVPGVSESDDKEMGQKILVVIASDRMGFGDDDLGRKLMISFIKTLGEMGDDLWRIVLVNNGVKLTIEGSAVLETLQAYEKQKISIWVCGTCLTHFDLLNEKQVGETTNMLDIVTAMQLAAKVITL